MNTTIEFNPLGSQPLAKGEYPVTDLNTRLTRSNFFDGRLLTALDLTREQVYIDERLRELGRSHGYGVIHGFDAQLSSGQLTIDEGRALSPSGRVLELNRSLTIDLNDSASISLLNNGQHSYINRGLYAIVIQYAERTDDLAEVFPTDLSRPPEPKADVISEGLKMSLVSLSEALSQQDEFSVRESLMTNALNHPVNQNNLPEDSIALGVIAFENHSPIWLDSELLRHPLHSEVSIKTNNEDFFRRHYHLFHDILTEQKRNTLTPTLHARDFFSSLPPVGPIPKGSIDTNEGTQNYFPAHFSISIVPVNYNELNSILAESLTLSPIDLSAKDSQDIMVLAPLAEPDYLNIAQKMEANTASHSLLPAIQPFSLLPFRNKINPNNSTSKEHWDTLWGKLDDNELFYIKRPQRTAETGVSAIVLARGAVQVAAENTANDNDNDNSTGMTGIVSDLSDANPGVMRPGITAVSRPLSSLFTAKRMVISDENETLMRQVNLKRLSQLRPAKNNFEKKALEKLAEEKSKDSHFILGLMDVLILIERKYDTSLWRTLLQISNKGNIKTFVDYLSKEVEENTNTAKVISKSTLETGLPLTDSLKNQWLKLSEEA